MSHSVTGSLMQWFAKECRCRALNNANGTSWLGSDLYAALSATSDRYRPADIAEVEQKVSLLNEPIHDEVN